MKLSQLIQHLQAELDQRGDVPVQIDVRDYFTAYGNRAEILDSTPHWNHTTFFCADGTLTITASLKKNLDGAQPKVTFRK
jgi:hypothetical protein